MKRTVVILGYASECDREKGTDPHRRVVETRNGLELAVKELGDQDLWLDYRTKEGKKLSKRDALFHFNGR